MTGETVSASSAPSSATIATGTIVGGRFKVERAHSADSLGETLLARDQKTKKPIAIRVLSNRFAGDKTTFDAIRSEVKTTAKLKHRSLVGTYGVGTHGGSAHFIACEWVQGANLAEFVAKRTEEGRPISLRGIYNVVAHVCKALTKAHEATCHGAVRPSVIWVTKSGRVKVGDLGLAAAMINTGHWSELEASDQAYLAPEVKAGGQATRGSDVFGVGAVLYAMACGRSPIEDFVPPSQAHPDAGPELDAILMRCLAADPDSRFTSPGEVSDAILPLVAAAPEAPADDFGDVGMEIDVDIAASLAPPAPGAGPLGTPSIPVTLSSEIPPAAEAPPPPVRFIPDPLGAAPVAPSPPVSPPGSVPGVVPPPSHPLGAPPTPAATAPAVSDVDFSALMAKLTADDAPRWMAVKDGMDHGPFSARELVKLIVDGEITEDNQLLNMSSNDRRPLGEYDEFREFVEQYKLRKQEKDFQLALDKSNKVEKRSNAAKFVILSASIVAVLGGGLIYMQSRKAAEARKAAAEVDLAALYDSGQVKIKGTAGILKYKRRKGGGGARRSGAPGAAGGLTYEDAMNQAMEMGDATKGGGERQLRSSDVAAVMNRKLNSLFGCVSQELRKGGKLSSVRMDLAILGSGTVAGVSVNGGSPAFKKCIAGKVRRVKFPSFPAPRMGARYSFDVD